MNQSFESQPSSGPAQVTDSGKIILGAGIRLPTTLPHVADGDKVRLGAGIRLPAERKTT